MIIKIIVLILLIIIVFLIEIILMFLGFLMGYIAHNEDKKFKWKEFFNELRVLWNQEL